MKIYKSFICRLLVVAFVMIGVVLLSTNDAYASAKTIEFDYSTYHVKIGWDDSQGTVSISGSGSMRNITAEPKPGYIFWLWNRGGEGAEITDYGLPNTYMYIRGNCYVTAKFVHVITNVSPKNAGSVSYSASYGSKTTPKVTFTATPTSGKVFDHWEVNGANVGTNPSYSAKIPSANDYTITAVFTDPPKLWRTVRYKIVNGKSNDGLTDIYEWVIDGNYLTNIPAVGDCILRQSANLFAEQNDREAVFIGREAESNGQILSIT